MGTSVTAQRLNRLREAMRHIGADYFYVPSNDPHQSEYVPDHWQRRRWISGFSGSAGDALIGLHEAFLLTDPRYFLQAEKELDPNCYHLIKSKQASSQQLYQWLLEQPDGFTLAIDPQLVSIKQAQHLQQIATAKHASLHYLTENLIDRIWQDRPLPANSTVCTYTMQYAGESASEKIKKVQTILRQEQLSALVVNDLASVAWLFNVRGNDIDYNPMVISTAIITTCEAHFFVNPQQLSAESIKWLQQHNIQHHDYGQFCDFLQNLRGGIWLDPLRCSQWISQQLDDATIVTKTCPIPVMKAIKNNTEIQGMKRAHIEDALALLQFFYWLENNWQNGVNELSAANQLNTLRRSNPRCTDLSFNTISGFAKNGAVIHYAVTEATNLTIDNSSLYLLDSGGQYLEGTTDVTRTIHLGTPTAEQKKHYTLVLKGHLAIRQAVFPHGTCGEHLDALARAPLWKACLDYGHGTGHGVGCYSCVHESPPRISANPSHAPLLPGMVVSNEPGVYFDGRYGIRIENLCLVKLVATPQQSETGHGPFYGFEDLTLFPYCLALIDKQLLGNDEINAINSYHQHIQQTLTPEINDEQLKSWLKKATQPL